MERFCLSCGEKWTEGAKLKCGHIWCEQCAAVNRMMNEIEMRARNRKSEKFVRCGICNETTTMNEIETITNENKNDDEPKSKRRKKEGGNDRKEIEMTKERLREMREKVLEMLNGEDNEREREKEMEEMEEQKRGMKEKFDEMRQMIDKEEERMEREMRKIEEQINENYRMREETKNVMMEYIRMKEGLLGKCEEMDRIDTRIITQAIGEIEEMRQNIESELRAIKSIKHSINTQFISLPKELYEVNVEKHIERMRSVFRKGRIYDVVDIDDILRMKNE